ncbi:MAG TPA: CDP-alcohol phosphatidyltransferase family protein [Longimicrobiales bacterium]|nr:CDP-alcohol phosphatidyltransferase family protein [Longimicrobiales bacterium]
MYTDLALAVGLVLVAACATWWLLGLPASYVTVAGLLGVVLASLVLWSLPAEVAGPGIGAANRVTLARAALAVPVFALASPTFALGPGAEGVATRWWVIVLSTAVMVLDGVDGRVARRTGSRSAFGARFDMELDAALILVLSVLVWRTGRVDAWVLLIGLMRYLFVAASRIWPALGAELPASTRRKVVCVVQGVVLLVALGPIIPEPVAVGVTAAGLVALCYSFAVDVRWALSHGAPR